MKKLLTAAIALAATPAFAHHPLAGAPMETFGHGLLSGIGHPVLGFDHLFFVIAIGVAALFTGAARLAPLAYVGGMLAGCALIAAGITLPLVEFVIALSLFTVGAALMSGKALPLPGAVMLFAAFGLFHGWAFGGTITGQEGGMGATVIAGYLIGLAAVQWLIAVAAGWVVGKVLLAIEAEDLPARLTGGLVAGVGVFLLLEHAEGAAFVALGLS